MRICIGCAPLKSGLAEHKGKNSAEILRFGIFWIFSRSIILQYGENAPLANGCRENAEHKGVFE